MTIFYATNTSDTCTMSLTNSKSFNFSVDEMTYCTFDNTDLCALPVCPPDRKSVKLHVSLFCHQRGIILWWHQQLGVSLHTAIWTSSQTQRLLTRALLSALFLKPPGCEGQPPAWRRYVTTVNTSPSMTFFVPQDSWVTGNSGQHGSLWEMESLITPTRKQDAFDEGWLCVHGHLLSYSFLCPPPLSGYLSQCTSIIMPWCLVFSHYASLMHHKIICYQSEPIGRVSKGRDS